MTAVEIVKYQKTVFIEQWICLYWRRHLTKVL